MNQALRRLSFYAGIGLLILSIYWSQDGFNFDVAGQSGYKIAAIIIGVFLAIVASVVEFVFSTNYRELNATLKFFWILSYAYSMYTNYKGILHFQGNNPSQLGAIVLGIVVDGLAEPLISWSLRESLTGDFIGNLIKTIFHGTDRFSDRPQERRNSSQNQRKNNSTRHIGDNFYHKIPKNDKNPKFHILSAEEREEIEEEERESRRDERRNRFE